VANNYACIRPGGSLETRNLRIDADASVARFVAGVAAPCGRALGGVTLFLVAVAQQGAELPTVTWELHHRYGESDTSSELVTSGTLAAWTSDADWSRRGSIVEVSGGLATGYEWRARVSGAEPLRVGLLWVVGSPTGLARAVAMGGLC
jgi:hypothetical protein